jgi:hypothetical protein
MGRKRTKPLSPPAYQFKEGERVIYVGNLYSEYHNQKCIVIEHGKKTRKEYDKVEFDDGMIFETIPSALKKIDSETI